MTEPPEAPVLRIVRGHPTDEELAALVVVLTSRVPTDPAAPSGGAGARSGWSAYWRAVRAPLLPGPGAWRASGRDD